MLSRTKLKSCILIRLNDVKIRKWLLIRCKNKGPAKPQREKDGLVTKKRNNSIPMIKITPYLTIICL